MTNTMELERCLDTVDVRLRDYFDSGVFCLVHELGTQRNFAFKTIVVVVGGLGNEAFLFNRSEREKQHFWKFSEKKKKSSQKRSTK